MNSNLAGAEPEIATRDLPYADQDTQLTGFLCWNPAQDRPQPGILLIHGGAGLDDHARQQARRYAALGYTVLAGDMYGDGVAGSRERVMATLMALRDDPAALVRRGAAGLATLAACPQTAGPGLAAVGFCFGGLAALALARSGRPDLAAVVTMHGSLATMVPAVPGAVRARLLVCHGAQDPHVPMTDVTGFAAEMTSAGAEWQLNIYGSAMHGFTHQHAVPGAQPGVAYDAPADERSFAAARDFLAGALPSGRGQ
ncbi:MAG TPA: dienelactone hydrolase family protein [Streptosporangiaceae bacterium]|nr:dienelactone hydrolase family protein [Streptosporangiaceae bacterium]